ncbi:MAG: glycosyltransferase [Chlorobiaceae bacterium]|nr:glycosyltransferase [Chlorobiaceae bacterium]
MMNKPIRKLTKSIRKRARKIRDILSGGSYRRKQNLAVENQDTGISDGLTLFNRQQNELSTDAIRTCIDEFNNRPLFSVLTPVFNTPVQWLEQMVRSLQEQLYENWELCIVDDCSTDTRVRMCLTKLAEMEPRIRLRYAPTNGGISAASNFALSMATGEYIALLDHDDELTPDALFWFAREIREHPEAEFLYSDECKIDDSPERKLFQFVFKPDWSPEMLLNTMYTGHLSVYRKSLVEEVGGFRSAYDFSQDYDLALRISEKAESIRHIERVLYLWRAIDGSAAKGEKDFARISNLSALEDTSKRRGLNTRILAAPNCNRLNIVKNTVEMVSIIIPSDSGVNIRKSLDGILLNTSYGDYEVVVVCNSALAGKIEQEYAYSKVVKCSRYDKPFNFSDKCNQGARTSSGAILVFYNDDVIPQEAAWLYTLTEYLSLPGVGGVSPKLVDEHDRIQYAGMISGTPGFVGTAYNGFGKDEEDEFLSMHRFVRNVTVLSGACMAMKKSIFKQIDGFDAVNTPNSHSDVDLSYRILEKGLRCVYTPHTVLTHISNHTWHTKREEKDRSDIFLLQRWGNYLERDPYFTKCMKEVLFHDFPHSYQIFAANTKNLSSYTGKNILLISHDLTLTGAPLTLLNGSLSLLKQNHFCTVLAPEDGPMRQMYIDSGIPVIVDAMLFQKHWLTEKFMKNFDLVIVNTFAGYPVINQLAEYPLTIIWWLHESAIITELFKKKKKPFTSALMRANAIISVSDYAQAFLDDFASKSHVIWNGTDDCYDRLHKPKTGNIVNFCLVGTVEQRKAQDLFLEAIALLPEQTRKKGRFVIMGRKLQNNKKFDNHIARLISKIPEAHYLNEGTHDESIKTINDADVLVCPSHDESSSLVTAEALMLGKPVIISTNVGIGGKLENGSSCLKFNTGNAQKLSDCIADMLNMPEMRSNMGLNARNDYEQHFTSRKFETEFTRFIESFLYI